MKFTFIYKISMMLAAAAFIASGPVAYAVVPMPVEDQPEVSLKDKDGGYGNWKSGQAVPESDKTDPAGTRKARLDELMRDLERHEKEEASFFKDIKDQIRSLE